ncbi:MAG: hypothetical protein UHY90_00945 [Treponema sp.]|nr:hypothetical protein [Spirochaetia bacterium]MDD7459801.1 hypothetical protein [Spirochaetales bacterium]MDY5812155.1 hypothetical protein [Treponema sp.]MEE1180789.1 hypothetical protein [Treponema sp.]
MMSLRNLVLLLCPLLFISCATTRTYTQIDFEKTDEDIAYVESTATATVIKSRPDFGLITFDVFCMPFVSVGFVIKEYWKCISLPFGMGIVCGMFDCFRNTSPYDNPEDFTLNDLLTYEDEKEVVKKLENSNNTNYAKFRKVVPKLSISQINGTLYEKEYRFDGSTNTSKSKVKNLTVKDTVKGTVERTNANVELFFCRSGRKINTVLAIPSYVVTYAILSPICYTSFALNYIFSKQFRKDWKEYKEERKKLKAIKKEKSLIKRRKEYYSKR